MAILSNLTKGCVLCKFSLRIGRIVNKKLKIGVRISFFCFKIQNIKFRILNGRTVHGPVWFQVRNSLVSSVVCQTYTVAITHRPFTVVNGLFTSEKSQIVCGQHFPR